MEIPQETRDDIAIFSCLLQAMDWQVETFRHHIPDNQNYIQNKIKKFVDTSEKLVNSIQRQVNKSDEAVNFYDVNTSFFLDLARITAFSGPDDKSKEQIITLIDRMLKGEIKVSYQPARSSIWDYIKEFGGESINENTLIEFEEFQDISILDRPFTNDAHGNIMDLSTMHITQAYIPRGKLNIFKAWVPKDTEEPKIIIRGLIGDIDHAE